MGRPKFKMYENLVYLTQIGISMIVPIIGSLLLGKLVDDKLGTGGIFLFVFIILGVAVAFMNVYKLVMRDYKKKGK